MRTTSKRRGRTPRVLQKETDQPTSSTLELRSGRRNNTSRQENGAHAKNGPSDEVAAKYQTQDENLASPTRTNSRRQTSTSVNGKLQHSLASARLIRVDENAPSGEFKTPQHPKFRDALAASPATPKHRVQVGASPLTPRTPRQTSSPAAPQTVYTQARQLFSRGANAGQLVGREAEREKLASFIQDGIESQNGGCLYVSGPPGTGKSAMVEEVCHGIGLESVKVAHVNCTSMRAARDIYSKLVEIFCDNSQIFKKSEAERLKAMFIPTKKGSQLYLVTLDEIDHLLTADAGVLQSLFEWSLHSKSSLLLIGIANALDLTDRSLPRLKAKNLKPRLLPFMPYNASQIANVLTGRLRTLVPVGQNADPNFVPFVQPAAIQLCAKKVASQTGDLRKAFELVKSAIDLIEQETLEKQKNNAGSNTPLKTILVENNNLSSPARSSSSTQGSTLSYTTLTAPRASIGHVARITSSAFGQGTVQRLQCLNLQQKAAICALIALDRKRRENEVLNTPSKIRNSAPTIKQIFDTYCALCRNDNILHPLTPTEFKDVLSNLETLGLVGEFHARGRGGGSVAAGSDPRRTPSRSGSGASSTPSKGLDEQGLVCFVSQREIESQIAGPGEGILRRLLLGQGL